MTTPPNGMHVCPTRTDGHSVLFAHSITPGMCQDRQRGHYHKCFACVHNNARANGNGSVAILGALTKLPPAIKVSAG